MLHDLTVESFRALEHFEMSGLGRINLLVGTNNCGKTSVLEAIQMLATRAAPSALQSLLVRRGERVSIESEGRSSREPDIRHLFRGHELRLQNGFSIEGSTELGRDVLRVMLVRASSAGRQMTFPMLEGRVPLDEQNGSIQPELDLDGPLALSVTWSGPSRGARTLPLTSQGGLDLESWPLRQMLRDEQNGHPPVRFITSESLRSHQVVLLLEHVMLTPEQAVLMEALRTIEPTIDGIAPVALSAQTRHDMPERGGVVVRCTGESERIPIGSMGDGVWRLLSIALCLVRTQSGILLVDEIDTGLHYTVMADMWRLVMATAKRLNVQVVATTHNRDCYESLAAIARADIDVEDSDISIQRLEKGRRKAVAFSEREIVIAAQRGIEVR
jgi:predicted ATPase